jgi:transposase
MDMSGAYIHEVRARAPQAVIAFDPFHVVKLANDAVHELRRTEARLNKGSPHAAALKGTRWALLKAPENLTPIEEARLSEVSKLNRGVYRAYLLKEELRALYACSPQSAPFHLDAWLRWAARSRLRPFTRLAATLKAHRDGILAAIYWGVSNSKVGLAGRAQRIDPAVVSLEHPHQALAGLTTRAHRALHERFTRLPHLERPTVLDQPRHP